MRVVFLGDCPFLPTSLGKMTYYITRGLLEKGHEVVNTCPAAFNTLWREGLEYRDPAGNTMLAVPWPGSLKPLVKLYEPDAVLLFGTPYSPPLHEALRECPELGVPCVGYFDNESLVVVPEYALHAANATVYAGPTRFSAMSIAEGMVRGGVPRDVVEGRVRVVPHGVDTELYMGARPEPIFSDGLFTFGTFSKNHIRKNIGALLHAYALLGDAVERTRLFLPLIWFGGGDVWKIELLIGYVEMLTGTRIHDRVVGLDKHERDLGIAEDAVLRIYASMDVFVFPSEGEAFGLPPLEAALMGLPLVLTPHPALTEVWGTLPREAFAKAQPYILPEAFGLVKPDPRSLSERMRLMMEDERLRRRVADEARRIASGYTWRRMADGIEALLEEAVSIGADPMNKYLRQK